MKMKKWMGACVMASMVLTQSPVSVLANEFTEVDQTNLEMISEAAEQKVFIGEKGYESLKNAIEEAKSNEKIVVKGNVKESITISENKQLVLEIAKGATLTNADGQHTIIVNSGATLTITGKGTIENISNGKAALVNNGTAYLNGAKFTRDTDTHTEEGDAVDNSFYTVQNLGTMEVNHATIYNAGKHSSCITNGWKTSDAASGKQAKLTINDGAYISGGLNSVKNDENGELTVTGGTIISNHQYAIMNWNKVEIKGGHIENNNPNKEFKAAIHNGNESKTSVGQITISGDVVIKGEVAIYNKSNDQSVGVTISGGDIRGKLTVDNGAKVTVTGGSFTKPLPDGVTPQGNAHVHTIVKVSKAPTCTEDGVEEHWQCSGCKQTFKDGEGDDNLTAPTVIPATGHTYTWVIDKEPTKDHAGAKYQYCMVCHHKTNPVSIPAIGYTEKVESAVYRAYNPNNGEHLYTANYDEFMHITNIGWHDEGIAFMTESAKDGYPLYRVYNPNSGLHHYTIDENEKNVLVSLGWRDEDVTMYTSKKPQCAAVFRVYNPNGGQHHYTKDANERNVLVSLGWKDEGIAFRTAEIPTK